MTADVSDNQHSMAAIAGESKVRSGDLKAYFESSKGLERDIVGSSLLSVRRAYIVSILALLLAFSAVLAVVFIANQPPPPPLVLMMDTTSGAVNALPTVAEVPLDRRAATDLGQVAQYVVDRESYNWYTVQTAYDLTGIKSSPEVAQQYQLRFRGTDAPDLQYGKQWLIVARIISIDIRRSTPTGGDAFVRYQTYRQKDDGTIVDDFTHQLEISYEYNARPLSMEDRLRNYTGFQVNSYRSMQEIRNSR